MNTERNEIKSANWRKNNLSKNSDLADVSKSVCKHLKGSSRGIIKGVEHWQCMKCKKWLAN